jgi:hypothetical protein
MRIPEERVVLLPSDKELGVSAVNRGILFVLVKWSGAFQLILGNTQDFLDLQFYDIYDELTQKFMEHAGDVSSGKGETYWLKAGRIIGRVGSWDEGSRQMVEGFTNRVLSQP